MGNFSDRNTPPRIVESFTLPPVANGALVSFPIWAFIAGGLADAEFSPGFILQPISGLQLDDASGFVSGDTLASDTLHTITFGVRNSVGPDGAVGSESTELVTATITVGSPSTGEIIEAAPQAGTVRAYPDTGGIRVDVNLDTTGVTARQWQRRDFVVANDVEDNWANIGSQAATDTSYLDTTAVGGTSYEYRVVDTVDSLARPSGTCVSWIMASAVAWSKIGNVTTRTDNGFVVAYDESTDGLTVTLDGVSIATETNFSARIHDLDSSDQPRITNVSNPLPVDAIQDASGVGADTLGIHYRFAPDWQRWLDLIFFEGEPVIGFHQHPRTDKTDNPMRADATETFDDTLKIKDVVFELTVAGIADSANSWSQRSVFEGVASADGTSVMPGTFDDDGVTDYGTSGGGRLSAAPETTNGIPSAYRKATSTTLFDYLEYKFAAPVTVDQLVYDYGKPVDDHLYSEFLGTGRFQIFFADGSDISVDTAVQQSEGSIGDLIGGPYANVVKVRQFAGQSAYGRVTMFGAIRGLVDSNTIVKAAISYLPDNVLNCSPFSFAVNGFSDISPVEVYNTGAKVGYRVAYDVAGSDDYTLALPGCGPVVHSAFAVGTCGAVNAFRQPAAQAAQTSKMPQGIHTLLPAGVSTAMDGVVANVSRSLLTRFKNEAIVKNWLAHGDSLNGPASHYQGYVGTPTQSHQGGAFDVALSLWQHSPTQEHWDYLEASKNFATRSVVGDFAARNHRLGAFSRKLSNPPRIEYTHGEAQDGYRHPSTPLSVMAELTGLRSYRDLLSRQCSGAAIVLYRESDGRNYYMGSGSRDIALINMGVINGYHFFGNVVPEFGGGAPYNTASTPADIVLPANFTYLDVLNEGFDTLYTDTSAVAGTGLKYWGRSLRGAPSPLEGQPAWGVWVMSVLCEIHTIFVAENDTVRAPQALEMIEDTATKYETDWIRGSGNGGANGLDVAYLTEVNESLTDRVAVKQWRGASQTQPFGGFISAFFALAYEKTNQASHLAKSLEFFQTYKDDWTNNDLDQRAASSALHAAGILVRIHGDNL